MSKIKGKKSTLLKEICFPSIGPASNSKYQYPAHPWSDAL